MAREEYCGAEENTVDSLSDMHERPVLGVFSSSLALPSDRVNGKC
jgi:hypothetical protein